MISVRPSTVKARQRAGLWAPRRAGHNPEAGIRIEEIKEETCPKTGR
jgi:hypothetical protein